MVVLGDFEIQLVEATSKTPYKEHNINGKTYFEVEPKAEYYIGFKKVHNTSYSCSAVKVYFKIDGKDLGFNTTFYRDEVQKKQAYKGLLERQHGLSLFRALQFVKPEITTLPPKANSSSSDDDSMLGQVHIEIYEQGSRIASPTSLERNLTTNIEARALESNVQGISKAKFVRTAAGSSSLATQCGSAQYHTGRLLDKFVLYYGTVPGLMQAGVVARPTDIFEAYLAINPHKRRPDPPKDDVKAKRVRAFKTLEVDGQQVVTDEKIQYHYDLTDLPSSDDE